MNVPNNILPLLSSKKKNRSIQLTEYIKCSNRQTKTQKKIFFMKYHAQCDNSTCHLNSTLTISNRFRQKSKSVFFLCLCVCQSSDNNIFHLKNRFIHNVEIRSRRMCHNCDLNHRKTIPEKVFQVRFVYAH